MEPLVLTDGSRHRPGLSDLALELTAASAGFRRSLPPGVRQALADLVRAMNCYYSNLIEGHDTHPVDIERALRNDYSADLKKRNLQLEAKAHVDRAGVDRPRGPCRQGRHGGRHLRDPSPFRRPAPARVAEGRESRYGRSDRTSFRANFADRDVKVGAHVPISPGAVPRFLARFAEIYGRLGRAETILATAAAHHRLLWIHPFLDGNGRVARLMSHAVLLEALDTGGVGRSRAGSRARQATYKGHLIDCDRTAAKRPRWPRELERGSPCGVH